MPTSAWHAAAQSSGFLRRWDVEVIAEQFIGHDLVDNIAEMRTVDVFMGFHGAGFVNSFYLQPVRYRVCNRMHPDVNAVMPLHRSVLPLPVVIATERFLESPLTRVELTQPDMRGAVSRPVHGRF